VLPSQAIELNGVNHRKYLIIESTKKVIGIPIIT
jgi:hypothetical protein